MSGWKDWAIGEVVTESEFQSFVQDQVVQVYDDSTDRDNTLGANVTEGMVCYLKDVNETQVYDGASWVQVGEGDITGVTAGDGLTGGGTSGDVSLDVDMSYINSNASIAQSQVTDLETDLSNKASTTHASTHESGGSDEIEIAQSQVTGLDTGTEGFTAVSNGSSGLSYQPVSHNYIINGAFDIWQRGDGPFTSDEYTADRWRQGRFGATFSTTIQEFTLGELDAIGYGQAKNYLRLNATTGNQTAHISTLLEDGRTLSGQDFTVSFYAKGTNPGGGNFDFRVFQRLDSGTVTAMTRSFTLTSSWQRFEFSGPMPSVAGKTITENNHIEVQFRQPFGDTSTDAWELNLWGVQLEAGSIATPFKRNANSIQGELTSCQRYYQKITKGNGVIPFSATRGGNNVLSFSVPLAQTMRNSSGIDVVADGTFVARGDGNVSVVTGANQLQVTDSLVTLTVNGLNFNPSGSEAYNVYLGSDEIEVIDEL